MSRPRRRHRYRDTGLLHRHGARVVIAGGGPAGTAAATELRRLGFAGGITVLSAEPDAPYDRPACSKDILTGAKNPRDIALRRPGPGVWWRTGRAVDLDPDNRTVADDTGALYPYDGLVIATGVHAILARGWPQGAPGLHLLHGVNDAWALRRELRDAARVAIVGGGLTGCETACSVLSLGREAVIIDPNPSLMRRALGAPLGRLMTRVHADHGTDLRLGCRVKDLCRRGGRWRLLLDDGDTVTADVVVVTAGERPDTGWLAASGLDITDGVLCDAYLRAEGADNVVAAGAVARWPNARYDDEPARCGQWIAAMQHGRAAARTLATGSDALPAAILPRYWTHQHDLRVQVAGRLDADADIDITALKPRSLDQARSGVIATYRVGGRVIGVAAVNAPYLFTATARALLAESVPVPRPTAAAPRRLAVVS